MAIIILGQSTCPLCKQLLQEGEDILGLPAFCDASHEFFKFSDAGYHQQCYESWNQREEVEKLIESVKAEFQQTDYFKKMLNLYGPPRSSKDQFVEVINSFKLGDDKIIVFLKWENGKLSNGTILDDTDGRSWAVQRYIWVTATFETYDKIARDEKNNIFQYQLDPLNVNEKPNINTFLKIQFSA